MESGKCRKHQRFYQRQHLSFALMVTNSLGQYGQDLRQFLWNLADHYAQTMFGFSPDENTPRSSAQSTQQLGSKQQTIVNSEAKNTMKIVKES